MLDGCNGAMVSVCWYETSALGLKSDLLHPNKQLLLNDPNIHPPIDLTNRHSTVY